MQTRSSTGALRPLRLPERLTVYDDIEVPPIPCHVGKQRPASATARLIRSSSQTWPAPGPKTVCGALRASWFRTEGTSWEQAGFEPGRNQWWMRSKNESIACSLERVASEVNRLVERDLPSRRPCHWRKHVASNGNSSRPHTQDWMMHDEFGLKRKAAERCPDSSQPEKSWSKQSTSHNSPREQLHVQRKTTEEADIRQPTSACTIKVPSHDSQREQVRACSKSTATLLEHDALKQTLNVLNRIERQIDSAEVEYLESVVVHPTYEKCEVKDHCMHEETCNASKARMISGKGCKLEAFHSDTGFNSIDTRELTEVASMDNGCTWTCPACDELNKRSRSKCNNCRQGRAETSQPGSEVCSEFGGGSSTWSYATPVCNVVVQLSAATKTMEDVPCVYDEKSTMEDVAEKNGKVAERRDTSEKAKGWTWTCPRCDEINKRCRPKCNNCRQDRAEEFSHPLVSSAQCEEKRETNIAAEKFSPCQALGVLQQARERALLNDLVSHQVEFHDKPNSPGRKSEFDRNLNLVERVCIANEANTHAEDLAKQEIHDDLWLAQTVEVDCIKSTPGSEVNQVKVESNSLSTGTFDDTSLFTHVPSTDDSQDSCCLHACRNLAPQLEHVARSSHSTESLSIEDASQQQGQYSNASHGTTMGIVTGGATSPGSQNSELPAVRLAELLGIDGQDSEVEGEDISYHVNTPNLGGSTVASSHLVAKNALLDVVLHDEHMSESPCPSCVSIASVGHFESESRAACHAAQTMLELLMESTLPQTEATPPRGSKLSQTEATPPRCNEPSCVICGVARDVSCLVAVSHRLPSECCLPRAASSEMPCSVP